MADGSPENNPDVAKALRQNFTEEEWQQVHVFYYPGGMNYERMGASDRFMMRLFTKMLDSKKDASEAERTMAGMVKTSYDISERKYLEPIKNLLTANQQ